MTICGTRDNGGCDVPSLTDAEVAELRALLARRRGLGAPRADPVVDLGWMPDVAPATTIRSAWGNAIRDRVVFQFATVADRDNKAQPVDGMLAWTRQERSLWLYTSIFTNSMWRVVFEPWHSVPIGTISITAGTAAAVGTGGVAYVRRYDVEHAEFRCHIAVGEVSPGVAPGAPVVIFPGGYAMDGGHGDAGHAVMWDAVTGLPLGGIAQLGGTPSESGFTLSQAGDGAVLLPPVAAGPDRTHWSGEAGSILNTRLHVNYF